MRILSFFRDEEGVTTVEYSIAGALLGSVFIGAFEALGAKVADVIDAVTAALAGGG
jgi:pilus assembly protein Flp/PilA